MFTNNNLYKTTKFQPFSLNYYSQILEQPKNLSNTEFKKPTNFQELKEQNLLAQKRNEDLLKQNHKSILDCYLNLKNTKSILMDYPKYNLGKYLNSKNVMMNQNNISEKILTKQNELLALESILKNQSEQNRLLFEEENDYCNTMKQLNSDLLEKVKKLAEENDEIIYKRKKLHMENELMEKEINETLIKLMNRKIKEPPEPKMELNIVNEEEDEKEIINEVENPILRGNKKIPVEEEEEEEEEDEELKEKKKQYKLIKNEIYYLNMNHKPGKLDEIRKKELEKKLQIRKKELEELYKKKKIKNKFEEPIQVTTEVIIEKNKNDDLDNNSKVKNFKASIRKSNDVFIEDNNVNISKLEDLNSKNIKVEDKLKVLLNIIEKIENYANSTGEDKVIYEEQIFDTLYKNKPYLKKIYYDLLGNPNLKYDIKFLVQLLFLIINSNYHYNLNPQNLKSQQNYDANDFQNDLNSDYSNIYLNILEHLKKMIQMKRSSRDFAAQFLSKALMNFEYDKEMLLKLFYVIEEILKKS